MTCKAVLGHQREADACPCRQLRARRAKAYIDGRLAIGELHAAFSSTNGINGPTVVQLHFRTPTGGLVTKAQGDIEAMHAALRLFGAKV